MLKINLLTERRDAEKEYRKLRSGAVVVNHLVMYLDTTVRRRIHQNIRNTKKAVVKRAKRLDLRQSRRTGMTLGPELLGRSQGQPNRDVRKPQPDEGKDRFQKFSRCLQCSAEFTTTKGRPTQSAFAFCGETVLQAGACKKAWNAAHLTEIEPTQARFTMVTPEDADHAERTRPKMPRPANLGHGRGSCPLPPNTEWVWDNEAGYRLVNRQN